MPPKRPEHRVSQTDSTEGSVEAEPCQTKDAIITDKGHEKDGSASANSRCGRDEIGSVAAGVDTVRLHRKSEHGRVRSKMSSSENKPEKKQLRFPETYMEIQHLNDIPIWLAPLNFVAAIFQCLQAVFILTFSIQVNLHWCVYTFYPSSVINDDDAGEPDVYAEPESQEIGCYSISWFAGFAVFMSGFFHLLCIVPCLREQYEYYIQRHQNPFRWMEYSISAPLMRVHVAQVAGVTDLYTLLLIFFVSQACICFGWMHEKLNAKNRADGYHQDFTAFWMAIVMHIASWAVIFAYFIHGMAGMDRSLAYGLIITLCILELSFPTVFILQWFQIGPFREFVIGELAFCMCSFVSKTFLAWATLIGANLYAQKY